MQLPSSGKSVSRTSFVVDASAAAKGVLLETESSSFRAWLAQAHAVNANLLAPYLLRYELGQMLCRQRHLDKMTRLEVLDRLLLGFQFADGGGAFDAAPPLSFYDASYLSLAKSTGATLVTYDGVLIDAAAKLEVPTLAPGMEKAAPKTP